MLLESLNIHLTSKNVGGKKILFKPSVQSSFRVHQPKIFKNINFLMSTDFSFRDSFNPPISNISSSKHWCMVCSKNICKDMYHVCLHSSVIMLLFKTYRFSGCPYACMWAPRKSSSKELDPVLYIVGSQWRNVREASGDTFYMSSTLIKGMPFILWHPISLYWGGTLYWDTRTSDSQLLSAV